MKHPSQLARVGVFLVTAVIAGLLATASPAQAATTVVSADDLAVWTITESDATVTGSFQVGPGTPPLGSGSFRQQIGADGGKAVQARTAAYNGVPLADLTTLGYSTYVTSNNGGQATYIILNVDLDGNGTVDDLLFFEPVYQTGTYSGATVPDQCPGIPDCVALNTWQTWDADAGGWWSLNAGGGPPLVTLAGYVAANPGAALAATSAGALRMVAGFGAGAWDNFDGNFDAVTVNADTYDFEWVFPAPTVHIEAGGDGFLNASEVGAGVMLSGTYDTSAGVDNVIARITNSATCDESASGTAVQNAVLNADGTWTAGPFDLSDDALFAEGAAVCARARAQNTSTGESSSAATSDNQPIKDTVAPSGTVSLEDGDGYVNAAELDDNLPATWDSADGASATVWFEAADGSIPGGCGTFSVGATGAGYLNLTCATNLPEGDFSFRGQWTDAAGNTSGVAVDPSIKDSIGPAGTITFEDGGDGYLNAAEIANEPDVTWTETTGEASSATVWFQSPSGIPALPGNECGPSTFAATGSGWLNTTCSAALPDGDVSFHARWADAAGNTSEASLTRIKDVSVPTATVDLLDGDGLVVPSEASSGVPVSWEVTDTGPAVTVSVNNPGEAAPAECVYGGQPRGPVTGAIQSACFAALSSGPIEVAVAGGDDAGNAASALDTSYLKRDFGNASVVILDESGGGFAPGTANAEETADGTILKVRVDLDPATVHGDVTGAVTVSDGTTSATSDTKTFNASSPAGDRTFSIDISGLQDGELTATATLTDTFGFTGTGSDTTVLDTGIPTVAFTTAEGEQIFRFCPPLVSIFFCLTSANVRGTAADGQTAIQFVHAVATNLDSGNVVFGPAAMSARSSPAVDWTFRTNRPEFGSGEWEVVVRAQDEAGNLSAPQTLRVVVTGLL